MRKKELIDKINGIMSDISFTMMSCLNILNIQYDSDKEMSYVLMCFPRKRDMYVDINKLKKNVLTEIYNDLAIDFE